MATDAEPKAEPIGIVCPRCGCAWLRAIYTRRHKRFMIRGRECNHCGRRIRTKEMIDDGKRE